MHHAKNRSAPPLRAHTLNTRDGTGNSAQIPASPRTGRPESIRIGFFSSFRRKRALEVTEQRFELRPPGSEPHKQILPDQDSLVTPKPIPKKTLGTIPVHGAGK